jgi:hypothetical protein
MSEPSSINASPRQLKLFHLENPLTIRFGNEFFRALPAVPGVYFLYGSEGQLLYIGQSADLRARIGSYRHVTPEQNPKRILRLVSKVVRIEWRECTTPAEAVECERVLLLEHRPPFNRAGVWQGDPWWLAAEERDGYLFLDLTREQREGRHGPLPSSFRYVFGSLVRCVYRLALPERSLADFPHGITGATVPLNLRLTLPNAQASLRLFIACMTGHSDELILPFTGLPPLLSEREQEFWREEVERVARWASGGRMNGIEPTPPLFSS